MIFDRNEQKQVVALLGAGRDHGVGSTDHFSALKIWMFKKNDTGTGE